MARITLSTHWKFQRLARSLGSKVLARGVLETLWEPCWVAGDAYCGTSQDIELLCEWKGAPGALTTALLMADAKNAGFIEPYTGQVRRTGEMHYQVHDFFHHCPEYVRKRHERELELTSPKICVVCRQEYFGRTVRSKYCGDRCRQLAHRDSDGVPVRPSVTELSRNEAACHGTVTERPESSVTDEVEKTPPCHDSSVTVLQKGVTPNIDVSGTKSDDADGCHGTVTERHDCHGTSQYSHTHTHTHTREYVPESSALENPSAEPSPPSPNVTPQSPPPLPRAPAAPRVKAIAPMAVVSAVVLTFPTVGKAQTWELREQQVSTWQTLFPNLDVLAECRKALAWVVANGRSRKTPAGMERYLVNWLNRSTDRGRGGGPTVIAGSLKTAGNKAAMDEILRRRGHVLD